MHIHHDHVAGHSHDHEHTHTHEHTHDGVTHSHAHSHAHEHDHVHPHEHDHLHECGAEHNHSHDCGGDCCGCAGGCEHTPMEELVALMKYMVGHNAAHAKELLDKGVTINKVNGKETLFTISPADGSYKVNFGKEEFETYFKEFLRPQMIEMLF